MKTNIKFLFLIYILIPQQAAMAMQKINELEIAISQAKKSNAQLINKIGTQRNQNNLLNDKLQQIEDIRMIIAEESSTLNEKIASVEIEEEPALQPTEEATEELEIFSDADTIQEEVQALLYDTPIKDNEEKIAETVESLESNL